MSVMDIVYTAFASAYLAFRVFILRAMTFFTQTIEDRTLPARLSVATRTVLLIGDGTAEGIGDTLGRQGLTTSLTSQLRTKKDMHKLRLHWRIFSEGRLYTTAADWLPTTTRFRHMTSRASFLNSHVIVILFGMHDDLSAGARAPAIRHTIAIAQQLLTVGKHVIVPLFPNFHHRGSPLHVAAAAANRALSDGLRAVAATSETAVLSFDTDVSKTTALGGEVMACEGDFFTLNSRGYRLLGADLFEEVVMAARKVEWAHWKDRLSG